MVDVSGIPNMGFGGGGYFGGIPNVAPAMSAAQINAGMWGNYSPGAAQSTLNNIYGAGGFGAQPAYYAALGAAYGRQTGGFGGYGAPNADPFTPVGGQADRIRAIYGAGALSPGPANPTPPVQRGADLPAPPTTWQAPQAPQPAAPQWQPQAGGGGDTDRVRAFLAARGLAPPPQGGGGGQGAGWGGFDSSAFQKNTPYVSPYGGQAAPILSAPRTSGMPNLGYNPGMSSYFANPGMSGGAFQSRFGMGFPNAGTPSQYAPGAQMPPGFSQPYGADNPQGALPLGWTNSFNN